MWRTYSTIHIFDKLPNSTFPTTGGRRTTKKKKKKKKKGKEQSAVPYFPFIFLDRRVDCNYDHRDRPGFEFRRDYRIQSVATYHFNQR